MDFDEKGILRAVKPRREGLISSYIKPNEARTPVKDRDIISYFFITKTEVLVLCDEKNNVYCFSKYI